MDAVLVVVGVILLGTGLALAFDVGTALAVVGALVIVAGVGLFLLGYNRSR